MRDDTKNGCVADYVSEGSPEIISSLAPPPKSTLIFAPECWIMLSKRPRFQNFSRRHAPRWILSRNSHFQFNACKFPRMFFPVLCLLQSFCHLFKILSKTLYKALKFGQNIFLSASHMKYCINLILGEA